MGGTVLERLLRRDRAVVVTALAGVVSLSSFYLFLGAGMDMRGMDSMPGMEGMDMSAMAPEWSLAYFTLMLVMWMVMMAAMMLPSASPMILLHAAISRRRSEQG